MSTADDTVLHHATCVAVAGRGVLLRGASGAGKSDLALRLLGEGARLVADDVVALAARAGRLIARAAPDLAGKIEVRGLGIVPLAALTEAEIALVVDLVEASAIERLPEPQTETILGIALPRLALAPFAASAPVKLRLALLGRLFHMAQPDSAPHPMLGATAPPPAGESSAVLLVTGMSGAGKSTALKALEDLGYEVVDNLPVNLLAALTAPGAARPMPLAIGIDIRTREFGAAPFLELVDGLRARPDLAFRMLFLDAEDETLQRRFSQTRRRHPLAHDRPIGDGIASERRRLAALRDRANSIIDTTDLTDADLRRTLREGFGLAGAPGMSILLVSFAYGRGVPRQADLLFDVRFLRNPHYVEALRGKSGEDAAVGTYIEADPEFAGFFERLTGFLAPLLPRYQAEGKSYLTVAFGCTGGYHRSVFVVERVGAWLAAHGHRAAIRHRELEKDKVPG
jgi:RNase adaptor protein for sRNA GlmZ degradation